MAFLMDNWLFGRPPAPISSTTAETHRRHWTHIPPTSQEYEIHENQLLYPEEKEDGGDEDETVTRAYIETNWNEPASLYSREVLTSQEAATKSTFTSSSTEGGKSISSSSNSPSIVARELPTSTENSNPPVSRQRTRATQTLPTTSGEQQGNSPTEAEGPEVRHSRNRNRFSLTGRRQQQVQDNDGNHSDDDDDVNDNKKSATTITPKKEVKTTTEEVSKPPEKKPEEKKKKPTDGGSEAGGWRR